MRTITIRVHDKGYFDVDEGYLRVDRLTFGEMIEQIISLVPQRVGIPRHPMLNPQEREAYRQRYKLENDE